jgi:hypothetical protein
MMERIFNFSWMKLGDRRDGLYRPFLIEVKIQHGLQKSAKFPRIISKLVPQFVTGRRRVADL